MSQRANGTAFLRPSIFIEGASGEGLKFGVGGRLTFLNFGGPASEWRTDLAIGTYNVLGTEYYYRLRGGKWFVAPRAGFQQNELTLYDSQGHETTDFDKINYNMGGDVGYAFGRFRELRVGYEYGHVEITRHTLDTGARALVPLSGRYGMTRAVFRRDSRNGPLVPTHGTVFDLRMAWFDKYPGVVRDFAVYEGSCKRRLRSIRVTLWPSWRPEAVQSKRILSATSSTSVDSFGLARYRGVSYLGTITIWGALTCGERFRRSRFRCSQSFTACSVTKWDALGIREDRRRRGRMVSWESSAPPDSAWFSLVHRSEIRGR